MTLFERTHQFGLFCTSTKIQSSAFSVVRPTDFTARSCESVCDLNFTSTFLAKLYFELFTSTCTSRPIINPYLKKVEVNEPKYRSRNKEVQVEPSKYRKCRTGAYPYFYAQYLNQNYLQLTIFFSRLFYTLISVFNHANRTFTDYLPKPKTKC